MSEIKHVLSHRVGVQVVVGLLIGSGAMCPECGHGTRVTSKRWAACKKCGRKRIPRRSMDDCADAMKRAIAVAQPSEEPHA